MRQRQLDNLVYNRLLKAKWREIARNTRNRVESLFFTSNQAICQE